MPTKQEKEVMLDELRDTFKRAKVAIMTDYRGMNVSAMTKLRRSLRESGCELKVAKNTLTLKVARENGLEGVEPYLEGPTAIAFGFEDLVAPAKIVFDVTKEVKTFQIKGGVLEGRVIGMKDLRSLAELPPREVLLAKFLGGMQAPMYGFASVLQGTLRNFVYALEAVRKQKAGETA